LGGPVTQPQRAMAASAPPPAPPPDAHSLFECAICLSLLVEPVTIGCGHTFCRPCLVRLSQVYTVYL